jgi:hypothetical protein
MQSAGRAKTRSRSSGALIRLVSPRNGEDDSMGWLDAHEYLLIEVVARDRADDARPTTDVALASADDGHEMDDGFTVEPSRTGWCPPHFVQHGE